MTLLSSHNQMQKMLSFRATKNGIDVMYEEDDRADVNLMSKLRVGTKIFIAQSRGNANLGVLDYTDHSEAHTALVAEKTIWILKEFGYDEHTQMLGKVAGVMHDIENTINRSHHAEYSGILANEILRRYELSVENRIEIVTCISNHDESTGETISAVSAALIIADKTDVSSY